MKRMESATNRNDPRNQSQEASTQGVKAKYQKKEKTMANVALQGRIERYIKEPSADGYAIVALKTKGNVRVTVMGRNLFNGYQPGETVKVEGQESVHPRYGRQILANDVHAVIPDAHDREGTIDWITQAGIQGVGAITARKLVVAFGARTIDAIVEGDPRALEILGNAADSARQVLGDRYGEASFGPLLAQYGIGKALRSRIYAKYGLETATVIAKTPYRLINDIDGIAFESADRIAEANHVARNSDERYSSAIIDTLRQEASGNGHVLITEMQAAEGLAKRCGIKVEMARSIVQRLIRSNALDGIIEQAMTLHGYEVAGIGLDKNLRCEASIAMTLGEMLAQNDRCDEDTARRHVTAAAKSAGKDLNEQQMNAAVTALVKPVVIMNGKPGTGKTTVLDVIVRAWKTLDREQRCHRGIELASPTGQAAQNMNAKTGEPAQTLHALMGANGDGFTVNRIDADHIAIDESSMLDIQMAARFLRAVHLGKAQLLLIGDANQIAPVGVGRFFADAIVSGAVPTVELTEIRRQAKGSSIALGAEAILKGHRPTFDEELAFIEREDPAKAASSIEILYAAALEDARKSGGSVQVITPGHNGEVGTRALNERLAEQAYKTGRSHGEGVRIQGGALARVGDRVVQTKNDKNREICNGNAGVITAIRNVRGSTEVTMSIDGRSVTAKGADLGELSLAYALTAHKTQGSEYDVVILALSTQHWGLLRRTLLNTAVTRGKTQTIIVGSKRALSQAIAMDDGNMRQTTLAERLTRLNNESTKA